MLAHYLRFYHGAYGVEECRLHDPLAVAVLLDESIVELRRRARRDRLHARRLARCDARRPARRGPGPANARIAVAADTERFRSADRRAPRRLLTAVAFDNQSRFR